MKQRCGWVPQGDTVYETYHDKEWGVPVYDDTTLFEFLTLEGAQAGLSWNTVLKKREHYKKALDNFNYKKIAQYDEKKIEQLMNNKGIIRNKLKIRSTITNAQAFITIQKEYGSFANYLWKYTENKQITNNITNWKKLPATTTFSDTISKDLKKRGFKFVGSTIIYAYLQAIGIINDHENTCFRKKETEKI